MTYIRSLSLQPLTKRMYSATPPTTITTPVAVPSLHNTVPTEQDSKAQTCVLGYCDVGGNTCTVYCCKSRTPGCIASPANHTTLLPHCCSPRLVVACIYHCWLAVVQGLEQRMLQVINVLLQPRHLHDDATARTGAPPLACQNSQQARCERVSTPRLHACNWCMCEPALYRGVPSASPHLDARASTAPAHVLEHPADQVLAVEYGVRVPVCCVQGSTCCVCVGVDRQHHEHTCVGVRVCVVCCWSLRHAHQMEQQQQHNQCFGCPRSPRSPAAPPMRPLNAMVWCL